MSTRAPLTAKEAVPAEKPVIKTTSGPHALECQIQRGLTTHPGLKFIRLTVHQCEQGVCLEGLLESNDEGIDLCELVNQIAGVSAINHVVMPTATQH